MEKWPLGDVGDRYRTTATTLSHKDISIGLNLCTGVPATNANGLSMTTKLANGSKQYIESGTLYMMGALYLGFGNTRVVVNTEGVRNYFQNHVAHKDGIRVPIFKVLIISDKPYNHHTRNIFSSC